MTDPEISVVVPSHERPLRLRWLLEALAEQTLARERFEVIVVHDSRGPETEALLRGHELARAGVLRHVRLEPDSGSASRQRNAGWRAARAPVIAFTDDDCRPPAPWLERALAAARANPGAIVQGATRPDPDEAALLRAPHAHSLDIDPPQPWAQTCNILYPRELLQRVGGFAEDIDLAAGEDTELACRALASGARIVGAPEVLTWHAVVPLTLRRAVRAPLRWRDLPLVVRRHPVLRRNFPLRVFWTARHARLALALGGAAAVLAAGRPGFAPLAWLPWAAEAAPRYGRGPRGLARAAAELPGRAVVDLVEMGVLAAGSLRHRTVLL